MAVRVKLKTSDAISRIVARKRFSLQVWEQISVFGVWFGIVFDALAVINEELLQRGSTI